MKKELTGPRSHGCLETMLEMKFKRWRQKPVDKEGASLLQEAKALRGT